MLKFWICIIFLTDFVRGGESDPYCIFAKVKSIQISLLFTNPEYVCRDVQYKFDKVREGLKNCTRHKMNFNKLECLHKNFCTVGSTFRYDFDKSQRCLSENLHHAGICITDLFYEAVLQTEKNKNGRKAKEFCTNITDQVLDCMQENVAEPCGHEAVKVYKRILESAKSILVGLCMEASNVQADLIDTEAPEVECIIEATVSAAESSFVWITSYWSIVLGVLTAMKSGQFNL